MTSTRSPVLKISLSPEQINLLSIEAERTGVSRSEVVRRWAFSGSAIPKGSSVYSDAVEAASRAYSGIPRANMEAIVSAVIISLNAHADS